MKEKVINLKNTKPLGIILFILAGFELAKIFADILAVVLSYDRYGYYSFNYYFGMRGADTDEMFGQYVYAFMFIASINFITPL